MLWRPGRVIKVLSLGAVSLFVLSTYLEAELITVGAPRNHFFLPSRTLFFFRPDLYSGGYGARPNFGGFGGYGAYPVIYPAPSTYTSPAIYSSPICRTTSGVAGGRRYGVYNVVLNGPINNEVVRANSADLVIQASPARALVYVDEKLIGSARDFATERDSYMVIEGAHQIRLEFPGYKPFEAEMQVMANRTLHLDIELEALSPDSDTP